jgi:hypothetical protein
MVGFSPENGGRRLWLAGRENLEPAGNDEYYSIIMMSWNRDF